MSSLDSQDYGSLDVLTSTLLRQNSNRTNSVAILREKGVKCCCENESCSFFMESKALLQELEKDVQTAASLGKALLERHQHTLLEASSERKKLQHAIEETEKRNAHLEAELNQLESENSRTVDENRKLLVQLEEYNQGMTSNEIKIQEMQGDLDAVHDELARVSAAAAKAQIFETQLSALESEQIELKKLVSKTKEDEKAAVARWRQAERTISELTAEVERIEREHRMEKARAQNLMDRLEKRQLAERRNGTMPSALAERTAISQFMRDILAENNRLQTGLAELRDMLLASQEEVGELREQLLQFTNVEGGEAQVPLSRELSTDISRLPLGIPAVKPELHFHHHVHKEKSITRRVKRRGRNGLTLDHPRRSTESQGTDPMTPTTPASMQQHRWSQYSNHTRSTSGRGFPSSGSPQSISTFRDSSIFDRSFDVDSTRPSTADTEWDSASVQKFGGKNRRSPRESTGGPPFSFLYTEEIPENPAEDEAGAEYEEDETEGNSAPNNCLVEGHENYEEEHTRTNTRSSSPGARSMLRKSASHESLLVPAHSTYHVPLVPASFNPTSPAAIAAAAASKAQAMSSRGGSSGNGDSAAYHHLLLAGGSIRGKGLARSKTSKMGWFGGWGWGATPFGSYRRLTSTEDSSETDSIIPTPSSSGAKSPAISIASLNGKSAPAPVVLAADGAAISTGTSPAKSVYSARGGNHGSSPISRPVESKPVPIALYKSIVEEQLLQESLMESMQM
ncbi:hypothetical protein BDZ91DRAFT_714000 [Kalaharituber pfeilii]|nr:hypothetical protein BDZ91DRAFT_714000 [Kalaharituber pfeilii]